MTEPQRPLPFPQGTFTEITRKRGIMAHRFREQQPQINEPSSDTIPGEGSGDQ